MSSTVQYTPLTTNQGDEDIPPPYNETVERQQQILNKLKENLPTYETATDLPTYDEAERTKDSGDNDQLPLIYHEEISPDNYIPNSDDSGFISLSDLGTDGIFLICFLISFIFNWIGLLFSICLSQTIAGRCGALSGFGLSIIKWVFIVKERVWNHTENQFEPWLWWILVVLGALLFFRGCIQYCIAKRTVNRIHGVNNSSIFCSANR